MGCDILDFRCVWVNEFIGSQILTVLILGALFFTYTSYKKIGLKTTLWLACVFFPIVSLIIVGTSYIFAIVTLLVALLIALIYNIFIGNR